MKNITLEKITEAARKSFEGLPDERQRLLVQTLLKQVHNFAREVQLSHTEWRGLLAFLHRVGDISDDSRSEFSLLSDVMGLSSLVDLLASEPGATPGSVLGPFHTVGSPWLTNPANLIGANPGQPVLLRGRVSDTQGQPLPDASLDFWQNAANGLYWQLDPQQPRDNLRCQLRVEADGSFEIATIRAVAYQIPTDGPVWTDLMQLAGRSPWRPAHFHLIVSAPGYRQLVTELFDAADPYLDSDPVFGVREALVRPYQRVSDAAACQRLGLAGSECLEMRVNLILAKDGSS